MSSIKIEADGIVMEQLDCFDDSSGNVDEVAIGRYDIVVSHRIVPTFREKNHWCDCHQ